MTALAEYPELCEVVEGRPRGNGSHRMVWYCQKCRWAWTAAVMNGGTMPVNPESHVVNGRRAARFFDDPHMAIAAGVLAARITPAVAT